MELGRGTHATVFEAWPVCGADGPPAPYVLKRLLVQSGPALARLAQEAALGARLSSPHLLPVIAAELESPPYYLVTPRLEGETLQRRLERSGPLATPEALWIVRQLSTVVRTLWSVGWVHGDLKPANVMLSPTGHVTLLDLGLAQPARSQGSPDVTKICGTPAYLAPEVLAGYHWPDIWSEVYGLGLILLECLTGEHAEIVRRTESLTAAKLRGLLPGKEVLLAELLAEMLSRQPLKRPLPEELDSRLTTLEVRTFSAWK